MNTPVAPPLPPSPTTVAMVTLGCARNEVDSEELAGRLEAGGFRLVEDPADAETVVVNTCGFVEAAKKDSVDTLLAAADLKGSARAQARPAPRRRWSRSAAWPSGTAPSSPTSLPEADAVLGFDDYPDIAGRLRSILAGEAQHPHTPQDRRKLLPISPADRGETTVFQPGHGERRRLDAGPMAPLKLASGCDRRCTFCAIPTFRGSFVSRRPSDVLAEARWLADQGARELFLVSENSTSYGKDLGDLRLLETHAPRAGRGRRRRAGAGLLPAAGRDPARPGDRDRQHARGGGVLRPLLPARLRPGAPADAPVRRPRVVPRPARPGRAAGARGRVRAPTSSSASPARPRRTSRCSATS